MVESTITPRVSVIVPSFNSAGTLAACIDSLKRVEAGSGELQIIVVDNGSSDHSVEIARGFKGVTVLEESTPGAYPARNTGIRAAQAPIIAFTDSDCTVDSGWVQAMTGRLADDDVGIVLGQVDFPAAASLPLRLIGRWENAKAEYIARYADDSQPIAYCNNMAVRAELFREIGPFKSWKRAGDSEFAHRMARERPGLRIAFEPTMRVVHHEFTRARDRWRRLRLYTDTNQQIEGFQELTFAQRIGVLRHVFAGGGR
jgi:glycosyltransferase involved in cell wall biosynthesis